MNKLDKDITKAAMTLEHIIDDARKRQDVSGFTIRASPAEVASLKLLKQRVWIDAHWPIAWPNWPSGIWPKFMAFLQKVTRRLLNWYINPIVRQQNEFNKASLNAFQIFAHETLELRKASRHDYVEQQARLEALAARLDAWQQELKERES